MAARVIKRDMPKASLPIIAGVATDKGQLLTGGATSRIERHEHVTADRLNELIDALPAADRPVEADAIAGQKGGDLDASEPVEVVACEPESLAVQPDLEVSGQARADVGPVASQKEAASR